MKFFAFLIPAFWILLLFSSCKPSGNPQVAENRGIAGQNLGLDYASNFEMVKFDGFSQLKVKTPWKGAETSFSYIIYPRGNKRPSGFADAVFIETPVRSVACVSTTHVAMLDFLESSHLIKGLSGTHFVYNPEIRRQVEANQIKELGIDQDLDYEMLIAMDPDIVFTYGINANNNISKITEIGLTPVVLAEFMDHSPLGRAEWVKFLGLILGKEELANEKFAALATAYEALRSLTENNKKPTVMTGMGFEGTWFVPAGESYVAQSIKDAGGDYLWKDKPGKITLALDFEAVYQKAKKADKWINVGQVHSLKDIVSVDERYAIFESWQKGEVYNGNARISPNGGFDIYESAVVNPHLVLRDLIKAFHPELMTDQPFVYYLRLN